MLAAPIRAGERIEKGLPKGGLFVFRAMPLSEGETATAQTWAFLVEGRAGTNDCSMADTRASGLQHNR
jgi:hypothetical protein